MSKGIRRLLVTVSKVTQPISQQGKILTIESNKLLRQIAETIGYNLKNVQRKRPLHMLKKFHCKVFSDKYLLYTNVGISMGLGCAGDILEQKYEQYCEEIDTWDPKRTAHMGISSIVVGVICHYWYLFLDRRMPGRTVRVVMKKVLADQFICSPVYISAFFMTVGMLEKKPYDEIWQEIKEKAWKLYAAEWIIWPPAQFINFCWLPSKYRVFYDNFISLGYDVYTSQVKHRN